MTAVMTEVTVNVTQKHISEGRPCACIDCPVALAILDAMPDVTGVEVLWDVDGYSVVAELEMRDETRKVVTLPAEAEAFVTALDDGDPVEPFTFTMEVPS